MNFLSDLGKKDLNGKICLVRVDFNLKGNEINKNNLRIQAVLPTIKFLLKNNANVLLLSHRGRPEKYQVSGIKYRKKLSLKPVAVILEKLLNQKIKFISATICSSKQKEHFLNSKDRIFLLENLRFSSGEEKNEKKFAKQLASLGDIYINDAFAVSHRANASVEAITKFLPSYAGLLLEKEIKNLDKVMDNPGRPLVLILGGAKISDKIGLIENFKNKVDYILVGGGIANNFLKAQNLPIGDSIYEKKKIKYAKGLLKNKKIILPADYLVENRKILDVGSETTKIYSQIIKKSKTIIWNGPLGYIEDKKFRKSSETIADTIMISQAFAVIGGGETAALFMAKRLPGNIFISTGGGAMLEYLAGKNLPGIKALNNKKIKTNSL